MTALMAGKEALKMPTPAALPSVAAVAAPTVNQSQVDRQTADLLRRRKGTMATVGTGSEGTTAGSVAAKTLLGN